MVRVTRPPNPSYTNAQVAGFYFRPCRDQDDEVILEGEITSWHGRVVMAVERSIASELPASFGIMLDGWTHASEHYVAVFACHEINGSLKTPLLSMAPLLNEANDDLSVKATSTSSLPCYPATSEYSWYNVASLLKTDLRPVIRQQTRWSSTFAMVKRYFELLEFIDVEDDDIMELLPAPAANKRLRVLYQELRDIESVSKALQGRDVDLLDVPLCPDFDSGCVRVLRGNADHLTRAEKATLQPFAATAPVDARESLEEQQASFVERLRKRRRLYEERVEYEQLKSIPPTSNVLERFFSVARMTFGHQRHGLLPRTLETLLYLRENRSYWDASTVDSLQ
ncbi:Ribonuclease H-like domain [Phytophthora cactorum]|nr:Ribonuclease H-like domain [Phytophthora cactorum]